MGKHARWLSVFTLLASGACTDQSGCGLQPLPGGKLPADQTIEGGAQLRLTRQGLNKVKSLVPGLINDQLGEGFCLPEDTQATIHYCYEDQNQCNNGCDIDVALNAVQFVTTNSYTLTLRIDIAADGVIPTDAPFFDPCYIYAAGDHLYADADFELVPDATTGVLSVTLARITNLDLSRLNLTGSGGFCSGASSFADFLKDYFEQEIADFIRPRVNDLIQDFLPNPLGLEGVVDIGAMLAGISPGTKAALEARLLPGGYATVTSGAQQGLSLGLITGINADENPATRDPAVDSEPALCVPPLPPPDFGAAPYSLTKTGRQTFFMGAAPPFDGTQDPAGADLTVGISNNTLNQIGHHAVTSGALCMGIGTSLVAQLNVGTFGILVPSVGSLGSEEGNDPVLIVTRPQKAIDFTIGDNTEPSPALTVHLRDFELDVYPFLFERYTRAFTMSATIHLGVNLEFEPTMDGTWAIKPTLVGLAADAVQIKVLNNQFVAESAAQLEGALPSVFDLLTTQLTIPPIELPTFAGFAIDNPTINKASGPNGDFLQITANIDISAMPFAGKPAKSTGTARLGKVVAPPIEAVRAALVKQTGGALPAVTIDVDTFDARGRKLEWSYRLGNGMWRPYTQAAPLVISDRAFAWQGAQQIGLMSRVVGEPATASAETRLDVTIDSVGPHIVTKKTGWQGDDFVVRGFDVVGGDAIKLAFGSPGDEAPKTAWQTGPAAILSRADVQAYAVDGEVAVFLEDASGNRTVTLASAAFHGQAGASGCTCETSGGVSGSTVVLALLTLLGLRRRRRR